MNKHEREKIDMLIEYYSKCVKAYKEKNMERLFTAMHWLGHTIEDLVNKDPKTDYILDIKLIWKADPEEL